jgi:hypothetical protein
MCPVVTQLKRENELPFEVDNLEATVLVSTLLLDY